MSGARVINEPSSSSDVYLSEETITSRGTLLFVEFIQKIINRESQRLKRADLPTTSEALEKLANLTTGIFVTLKRYEKKRKKDILKTIDSSLIAAKKHAEVVVEKGRVFSADLKMEENEWESDNGFESMFPYSEKEAKSTAATERKLEKKSEKKSEEKLKKEKTPGCCFFAKKPKKKTKHNIHPEPLDLKKTEMQEQGDTSRKDTPGQGKSDRKIIPEYDTSRKDIAASEEDESTLEEKIKTYKVLMKMQEESVRSATQFAETITKQFASQLLETSYSIGRSPLFHLIRLYAAVCQYKQIAEAGSSADSTKFADCESLMQVELKKFSCSKLKYNPDERVFLAVAQLDDELKKNSSLVIIYPRISITD